MGESRRKRVFQLCALAAAAFVFVAGHWPALTNPCVINDDVRQQVYWMQQWNDPELFPDDLLTRYARNYVPWGVQAVYYLASSWMNPVQFSKVVAGILYVVTAGFLFGLGLRMRDERAGLGMVIAFFFFSTFMRKISGGLSQSFGFPLLAAYLYFLSGGRVFQAGLVILCASVLNPYIFVLCLGTHGLYLAWNERHRVRGLLRRNNPDRSAPAGCKVSDAPAPTTLRQLIAGNLPIVAGLGLMVLKYIVFKPTEFGDIVTWATMADLAEYGAAGRYGLLPGPSLIYEVLRPWILVFPVKDTLVAFGWAGILLTTGLVAFVLTRPEPRVGPAAFRVFGYLLAASLILYVLSYIVFMRLFLPRRYVEFSLNVFGVAVLGVFGAAALEWLSLRRGMLIGLILGLTVLGAVRNYHLGVYDYSRHAALYRFLETTPKTALIAGHPELMDNVPTFARRKAFATYELSHTWSMKYWDAIKERTFDFFRAYYAQDPDEIRRFAQRRGIDLLVVDEADFPGSPSPRDGPIYFQPFDDYCRKLTEGVSGFAALDRSAFPVIFEGNGIRVLKTAPGP